MSEVTRAVALAAVLAVGLCLTPAPVAGQAQTIYEIQANTSDGDASVYNYQVLDCVGGVCLAKFPSFRPRLILADPAYPDGWGGIQVKDWTNGDLYDNVDVGDWVALDNMYVEEFRGTTFLQWQTAYNPQFTIVSENNPLPQPLPVEVSVIPAPIYDPQRDGWYVDGHDAEPYESMYIIIRDVTVTEMDLGKEPDNYNLQNEQGEDCWASDYMNGDKPGSADYHPLVFIGQEFCAVQGVFEQYTNHSTGWDYYQLLTVSTAGFKFFCRDLEVITAAEMIDPVDRQPIPPP
ncbi:MAG: hypothetical protein KKB50_09710 [Planctomycetes bacterium]|nr:hypothetical protein [Planctomycetota bacterium]